MTHKTSAMLISFTIFAAILNNNQVISVALSADNSKMNQRDGNRGELTADEQGQTKNDLETTQRIRKAITSEKSLSLFAHNVKIITKWGNVTLRGSVSSNEERIQIENIAANVVGKENVQNELNILNN